MADESSIRTGHIQANYVQPLIGVVIAEDVVQKLMALHYKICILLLTSIRTQVSSVQRRFIYVFQKDNDCPKDVICQMDLYYAHLIIKLMIDYRSKLLAYSPKPVQRADEWSLINQHKSLEEEKAKIYEQQLQEQKRRQLKQQLDQQVRQRNSKEMALKHEDQYYAMISERQAREAKEEEERKRREQVEKRRQMEEQNRMLLGNIVESKLREGPTATPSLNIGMQAQTERMKAVQHQRRRMIDELDRQIQEKQQQKQEMKREEHRYDCANLDYQLSRFDSRDKSLHSRTYSQNPHVYNYYQQIAQKSREKQREFQRLQIEEAGKRKQAEELNRLHENNMNKKYLNLKMREVLDQQVRIKDKVKAEEERVNPQELTYGTLGRMLDQRRQVPNKQQYFEDLKRQIEDKQKRQQAEKFMSQQEYKLNLNQLNRAIQGPYASKNYVDRSIHALSENHKVNVSLIDAHLDSRPEAEIARKRLEELKARNRDKLSVSLTDGAIQHF